MGSIFQKIDYAPISLGKKTRTSPTALAANSLKKKVVEVSLKFNKVHDVLFTTSSRLKSFAIVKK